MYLGAALESAGSRKRFDGHWVIIYQGKIGGYLVMSAIDSAWLPVEIHADFPKNHPDELHLAVGYALLPTFREKGIASNALNIALDFAKSTLGAKYVFGSTNNLNEPSAEVLLRNGFAPIHVGPKRTKYLLKLD